MYTIEQIMNIVMLREFGTPGFYCPSMDAISHGKEFCGFWFY